LLVHLVFVVKYRRKAISAPVWASLNYGFNMAAKRLGLTLLEVNHDLDHAHLVVGYPPSVSVSELVNALKGSSAFIARQDCAAELNQTLRATCFWTPSFFAASCGGAPVEVLKRYVQNQEHGIRPKGRGFYPGEFP
jgi:putative transposase